MCTKNYFKVDFFAVSKSDAFMELETCFNDVEKLIKEYLQEGYEITIRLNNKNSVKQ